MRDLYQQVTDQIIQSLQCGVRPWVKPWNDGITFIQRPLRSNGIAYRGINTLVLWSEALAKSFSNPTWLTFKQATDLGGYVRKGQRGSPVFYANKVILPADNHDGQDSAVRIVPFLKHYTVFNVEQCEGLHLPINQQIPTALDEAERIVQLEQFIQSTGALVSYGGGSAYYVPTADRIQMPAFGAFRDAASFYSTLCHELIHWTGHESRLDRPIDHTRYGDQAYAAEELIAEIGSAFLGAIFELPNHLRDDHASYINSWLAILKHDPKAIFTAAASAQRAADFL